ncbi:uncharacterized protein isoform X2 [Rhodnius prolixus]|uniref:uncharacterized protein isoform X2 n=1 Tax=Rhodnius prolixus TaxID=13249 RepID=UPI003D18AEC4
METLKILLIVVITTNAIEIFENFACTQDFCTSVDCPQDLTKENCGGQLIPNSSTCGCCPTCVTYIEPYGCCSSLLENIRGPVSFYQHKCLPEYSCVNDKCTPIKIY